MKDQIIFSFFVLLNIFFALFYGCSDHIVNFSFILNFISISVITYYALFKEKLFTPSIITYIIFFYIFFFIAPIIQLSQLQDPITRIVHVFPNSFPNTLPFSYVSIIKLNCLIIFWNIVFFIFYIYFRKKHVSFVNTRWEINSNVQGLFPVSIIIILFLSALIVAWQFNFIVAKILHPNILNEYSKANTLILKKTLFSLPFSGLIMAVTYLRNTKKLSINKLIIIGSCFILFILFLMVKNPFIEKRNAIGPLLITLLVFFSPKFFYTNRRFFLFLFVAMVIAFPLMSVLTHHRAKIIENPVIFFNEVKVVRSLLYSYNTLHYDAYSNVLATMDYVSEYGITYGNQLLGGLLFFIPRAIWVSKPESTGMFIAEYLTNNYDMWFKNLSNPLLSESIINFGFLGIVIFTVILAWFIVKMLTWQYCDDLLKQVVAIYFSIHLLFLLRGDFTNGFAYFAGTFIGIYIIPKGINVVINCLARKSTRHT